MRLIFSSKFNRDLAYILPGEYHISREHIINTLLGSCVAVVLYSENEGIGGMNHFMLPSIADPVAIVKNGGDAGRYGLYAMELLINGLVKAGVKKEMIKAKVFGGGRVLKGMGSDADHIGFKNVDFVLNYLKAEKIPVVSKDVGGNTGRKVYFFPWNSKVLVSNIVSSAAVLNEEKAYIDFIRKDKEEKKIILFDND